LSVKKPFVGVAGLFLFYGNVAEIHGLEGIHQYNLMFIAGSGDHKLILSCGYIIEPEVAEAVGENLIVPAPVGGAAFGTDEDFLLIGIVESAADENAGDIAVINSGGIAGFRLAHHSALQKLRQLILLTEYHRIRGTSLHTAGELIAVIEKVGATRAFLADAQGGVAVYGVIGAGLGAFSAADAFFGVNDDKTVIALVYGALSAGRQAGGLVAVVAQLCDIVDLHLGDAALNLLFEFAPELADFGLGLCVGAPIVANVLILTGKLTVVAAVAFGNIYNEYFCHELFLLTRL